VVCLIRSKASARLTIPCQRGLGRPAARAAFTPRLAAPWRRGHFQAARPKSKSSRGRHPAAPCRRGHFQAARPKSKSPRGRHPAAPPRRGHSRPPGQSRNPPEVGTPPRRHGAATSGRPTEVEIPHPRFAPRRSPVRTCLGSLHVHYDHGANLLVLLVAHAPAVL
jgi:hypothetical protein